MHTNKNHLRSIDMECEEQLCTKWLYGNLSPTSPKPLI